MRYAVQIHIKLAGHLKRLSDIEIDDLAVLHDDDAVLLVCLEELDGAVAHLARHNAVTERRGAAALHMAENRRAGLDAGLLLNALGKAVNTADTLSDQNNEMLLTRPLGKAHPIDDVALEIVLHFGNEDGRSADGDTGLQGEIAAAAAHNLNDAAAVVRLGRIAQTVDHLHCGVHGGVKADGIFTARNIIVNGTRNTDARDARVGQIARAAEGAVAADDNDAVDAQTRGSVPYTAWCRRDG